MVTRQGILSGVLAIFLSISSAYAADESSANGALLMKRCQGAIAYFDQKQKADMYEVGWCLGFVKGIGNGYLFSTVKDKTKRHYCPPQGITVGQEVRKVIEFMQANSQYSDHNASAVAIVALIKAFPCPGVKDAALNPGTNTQQPSMPPASSMPPQLDQQPSTPPAPSMPPQLDQQPSTPPAPSMPSQPDQQPSTPPASSMPSQPDQQPSTPPASSMPPQPDQQPSTPPASPIPQQPNQQPSTQH